MCGIAGFVGNGSRFILQRMTRTLIHRGPDGEGYYFGVNGRNAVGLGHRRLSIIDLTGGAQPIFNEDKSVVVIFNGEIYNFRDLRRSLESRHKFLTNSDTEVIVHLYEEESEAVFERLNGMFAIAIYDIVKQRLILARDRLGKKPLYWAIFGNTIIFGSEAKSLMEYPLFEKEIDLESLNKYLSYEYVPTPRSIWKHTFKLEPATYLVWQNGKAEKNIFWKPDFAGSRIVFEDAVQELDRQINESVKIRLVSDVPLGVFLSGGIDSSTVAYYAQRNLKKRIKTFSVVFDDISFDESSYARRVADFLGADHFEASFRAKDLLELIPKIAASLDEPIADASILPTYLLSRFTKGLVTVALGGDGGDELFAGYPTFQADRLASFYENIPLFLRKQFLERIILRLPVDDRNFSLDFRLKKFIDGFIVPRRYRHQRWLGSFGDEDRLQLLCPEIQESLKDQNRYGEIDSYFEEAEEAGWGNAVLYVYLRTYLMDQVLVKVDRASMLNSLEVRTPLLDYRLVDFVDSLPYDWKCRGWTTKYILKTLMKSKIPAEIVGRPKKGFGTPLAKWLKNDLKNLCDEFLSESRIKSSGLFNYDYIDKLKQDHLLNRKDNRKQLWTLLVFQLWMEHWFKS